MSLPPAKTLRLRLVKLAKSNQFKKYIASGVTAFLVDFIVFRILYINLGVELRLSTLVGILSGLITGFVLQKLWAFKGNQQKKIHGQIAIYTLLTIINTLFTELIVKQVEGTGMRHGAELGKVIASGIIVIWNFAIFKLVVFKERSR